LNVSPPRPYSGGGFDRKSSGQKLSTHFGEGHAFDVIDFRHVSDEAFDV
jgi:hypothetical protein